PPRLTFTQSFPQSCLPVCDYRKTVHIASGVGIEDHQEPLSVSGDVELMEPLSEKVRGEQDSRRFGMNAFGSGLNSGGHNLPTTVGRFVVEFFSVSAPLDFKRGFIRDWPSPFRAAAIARERLYIELVSAGIVRRVGNPVPIRGDG